MLPYTTLYYYYYYYYHHPLYAALYYSLLPSVLLHTPLYYIPPFATQT